ncbi:MAG: TIGR04086 family membrane protein [Clostridia bacterium]|nr:TIGR04086 family membrane protein [Clostridia bacterium]
MTAEAGIDRALRVAKGVLAASAITLAGMAVYALAVLYLGLNPDRLMILNQVLKAVSILSGTLLALGRGGGKGLITGASVGLLYMVVGFGFYCLLDGTGADAGAFAKELISGAIFGAIAGIAIANLKPAKSRA